MVGRKGGGRWKRGRRGGEKGKEDEGEVEREGGKIRRGEI